MLHQRGGEIVADALVHQKARGRNADLARVAELGRAGRLHGQRHIGVFGHDHRRVAAELHRDALHVLAGQRGELLAHRRGAGESDLADHRVRDQVAGDLGRVAVHQAQHAGRQAGVGEGAHQFGRRGRGFLGRLDDHRAAAGQRGAELTHHLVDGEVPGGERGHGTHRVFEHHLPRRQVEARGHDAAIDAQAFVGEPVDDVGRGQHLALGLGQRLALLLGQHGRDGAGAVAHQGGCAAHGLAAFDGRHVAPGLEAGQRGGQRGVQVGDAGVGHAADFLAGGRVEDRQGLAAGGVLPPAVDEELGVGVGHEGPSCNRSGWSVRAGR